MTRPLDPDDETIKVSVLMTKKVRDELKRQAIAKGLTMTAYARELIEFQVKLRK